MVLKIVETLGPNPAGRAHSAPPGSLACAKGAFCSSPITPPPLSAFGLDFRPFGFAPNEKILGTLILMLRIMIMRENAAFSVCLPSHHSETSN